MEKHDVQTRLLRLKEDYRIFVISFVLMLIFAALASTLTQESPNSLLWWASALCSVMCIVYSVKVLLDIVVAYLIVKPTVIQILCTILLLFLFFSPLFAGLYGIRVIGQRTVSE